MSNQIRIDHLHRSLVNAQETIRFVDTKNGTVTGLSLLLFGGALSAMNFFISATPPYFKVPKAACFDLNITTAVFLFISFVCFCACLWHAGASLSPKSPGGAKSTLLFPYYGHDDSFELAKKTFHEGDAESAVISEYHTQIRVLGHILAAKIPSSAKALKAFQIQVWATALFAITGLFLIGNTDTPSVAAQPSAVVAKP